MSNRKPANVFPPGEFIKEEIDARGWTQEDLARILDKPLPTINQIIKGKRAIIADTAIRLGAAFSTSAELWMNLEGAWQLSRGEKASNASRVQVRARLYEAGPVREMERRGWLKKARTGNDLERELTRFYGVDDFGNVPNLVAAARTSVRGNLRGLDAAQWAWCRRAEQVSTLAHAKRFSSGNVKPLVQNLRRLMGEPEEARRVPKLLADAGIRFVIVEHLSHTKMDGAALWQSDTRPVIALSLRYGRLDYFWFTLLHELSHIANGDGKRADVSVVKSVEKHGVDDQEARANADAASWLVPAEKFQSFVRRTTPLYSTQRIMNFAARIGVHPSIVVGQLKFRGEIDWNKFGRLQVNVRQIVKDAALCDGWGKVAPVAD